MHKSTSPTTAGPLVGIASDPALDVGQRSPALVCSAGNHSAVLLSPLWLTALGLLLLNDHVLKRSVYAGAVTGKLSDFAGMLVAPLLLAVLLRVRNQPGWYACNALTVAVFAAMQLDAGIAASVDAALAELGMPWKTTPDPTDLIATPVALLGLLVYAPRFAPDADLAARRGARSTGAGQAFPPPGTPLHARAVLAARMFATCVGLAACLATSEGEPTAGLEGRVALLNASDETLSLALSPLRLDASPEDCAGWVEALRVGDPASLTEADFPQALEADIAAWGLIDVADGEPDSCGAALLSAPELDPTILVWSGDRSARLYENWNEGDLETYVVDGQRVVVPISPPVEYWITTP